MALRAVTSNGVAITPSSLTVSGTLTGSSGTATAASISPTINQSGTAGYILADFNAQETSTGSGTKLLQRWAVGGTTVGQMRNDGVLFSNYVLINGGSGGYLGFGSTLGGSADVAIFRDAAQTLALRNGANPQTFRVYNTYTDGSNYERLSIIAGATLNQLVSENAGTGTARSLRIGASTGADLILRAGGTDRWRVNSSGHLLAEADNSYDIGASGANRPRALYLAGGITHGSATLLTTTTALTNGAAAATGTLTNAPTAGNPTKWIPINDNGTTRYIPAW